MKVRTRFAPSPTGGLHIGGIRAALFNYLFAKKHGGKCLLRIEDTDSKRFDSDAEDYIKMCFKWLEIDFDEKLVRQSERKVLYKAFVDELIRKGDAYYAFDSPEALDLKRKAFEKEGKTFQYNGDTRMDMVNSLTVTEEDLEDYLVNCPYVVRVLIKSLAWPPDHVWEGENIKFNDKVKGIITTKMEEIDDKVIWKSSNELPTYHLASVIDDHFMGITHVIRGVEWISSTPLHVYLYQCLGWDPPIFAHLPLITHNGKKLSKRNADKLDIPINVLPWKGSQNFSEDGYSPEALINILSLLGWNPGTEQEIFTIEELIDQFSLDRVGTATGADLDLKKAAWINGQHLRKLRIDDLYNTFTHWTTDHKIKDHYDCTIKYIKKSSGMNQER